MHCIDDFDHIAWSAHSMLTFSMPNAFVLGMSPNGFSTWTFTDANASVATPNRRSIFLWPLIKNHNFAFWAYVPMNIDGFNNIKTRSKFFAFLITIFSKSTFFSQLFDFWVELKGRLATLQNFWKIHFRQKGHFSLPIRKLQNQLTLLYLAKMISFWSKSSSFWSKTTYIYTTIESLGVAKTYVKWSIFIKNHHIFDRKQSHNNVCEDWFQNAL